ncbi:hypothetical protein DMENIID0001_141970 [Sergentomyia squamirostris]
MTTIARRARISSLNVRDYILLNNRPCRIVEKYPNGHNRLFIAAMDVFTDECHENTFDVRDRFDVPHVFKINYKLVSLTPMGTTTLLTTEGAVRSGIKLPDNELGQKIREEFTEMQKEGGLDFEFNNNFQVTVTQSMGEEHITAWGLWEKDA